MRPAHQDDFNTLLNVRPEAPTQLAADPPGGLRFQETPMRFANRHGFSLIELVISIAIIAALAGVASVRFARSAERARVDAAAHRVVSAIDDARNRARTQSTACKVLIDTPAATLQIKGPLTGRAELDVVLLGANPYRVSVKSSNFGGSPDLEFSSHGRPVAGGQIKVISGSFERTVTVDPETGHATIS